MHKYIYFALRIVPLHQGAHHNVQRRRREEHR